MSFIFPRRFRSRLLAAALALAACGCGAQETAAPARATGAATTQAPAATAGDAFRILFLGDSISAGYGLAESEAFPALVQQRLRRRGHHVEALNAGVSGDTTAGGLSRLDWVLRSEPHLLVVELGGNDALRGQPVANIEHNLREIVRRGRAAGARVLLLGMDIPTNYGANYGDAFSELYPRVAREEGAELLPGFMRDVGADRSVMMDDGLHPTAEGHRRLADKLVPAVEPLLP